jgi:hypothetical protein
MNGELLAGTAAITKAEGRKAGMVAHRKRINDAVGRSETTIMDRRVATVLNFKRRSFERTPLEAQLIAFRFVYVVACRCL